MEIGSTGIFLDPTTRTMDLLAERTHSNYRIIAAYVTYRRQ